MIFTIIYLYQFLVFILNSATDIFKHKITFQLYLQRFFNLNLKKSDILLHACSCGEVKLLTPITKLLDEKNILYQLSIHTPSGYKLMKEQKNIFLKPFDNFIFMFFIFYRIRPKILIISSRDVWPFYIFWALYFNVKIYFVNYEIKGNYLKNVIYYSIATKIFLKNKIKNKTKNKTKNKLIKNNSKYEYLGNLKFLSSKIIKKKINKKINKNLHKNQNKKLRIVIASANENELDIHLNYMIEIIKIYPKIQFIYVPRHLNWFYKFKNKLSNIDYEIIFDDNNLNIHTITKNIIVIWQYGLLEKIYSYSNICIMGDTFNNIGGHNLIEPAINKNYIVTGPNIHTCQDIYNKIHGKLKVNNLEELIFQTKVIINKKLYKKYAINNQKKILKIKKKIKKKLLKIVNLFYL